MVSKGMVFSTISILLVLFFTFIFSTVFTEYSASTDDFYTIKANAIGNYFDIVVDYYIPVVFSNAGHSALENMINFTGENQKFIKGNFSEAYQSLIMNGTLNCDFLVSGCKKTYPYLQTNGLDTWLVNLSAVNFTDSTVTLSEATNLFTKGDILNISLDPTTIVMYHDSPWTVVVEAEFDIVFESPQFAINDLGRKISAKFPITDLRNPTYVNYSGNTLNVLYKNTTEIYNIWDIDLLKGAIKEHKFHANTNAPDFLMRLQGLEGASTFGAIGFIDPVWVNSSGPLSGFSPYAVRPFTDPAFFTGSDCDRAGGDSLKYLYNISGISGEDYEGFRLSFNDTLRYTGIDFNYSNIEAVCKG